MNMVTSSRPATLLLLWTLASPLSAQSSDERLYDAPLPDDAAYVRFLNYRDVESVEWRGIKFSPPDDNHLNDFFVVHSGPLGLDAGSYVTVARRPNKEFLTFVEPPVETRQALVSLINLSEDTTSLKTADGEIEIIGTVEPNGAGYQKINPVSVALGVFLPDSSIVDTLDLRLRRGERRAILIQEDRSVREIQSQIIPGILE